MDREQAARRDALLRARRRRMGRQGPPKSGVARQPKETMTDRFRMEQRRRLMNKRRDNLPGGMPEMGSSAKQRYMEKKLRDEAMDRAKKGRPPIQRPGMVAGAAVSVGKKNKDKIKKKIQDIGNMKVKDAAKKIAGGVGALTPVGIAQRVGKALERKKQPPRQEARPRDLTSRLKDIREKIKEGKIKPIPMPKVKEMTPLGKMKKPRPGTYDYQLLQTQKPGYRVAPMLVGGQAKLDKNKNKRIDAEDFKILKAEKAKGRGKGLQDEKMKPGKVMKAKKGKSVLGEANKPPKSARSLLGGRGGPASLNAKQYRKYLKGLKAVGKFPGIRTAGALKQSMKDVSKAGVKGFLERRAKLAGTTVKGIERAAKASRIGKIAAGVAAVGLGAKEFLKRKMEKRKRIKREKDAVRGLKEDAAVNVLKDQVKGLKKKMGGGMMMQRPMMAKAGKMTEKDKQQKETIKKLANRFKGVRRGGAERDVVKGMGGYMGGGLTEATQRLKAQGKMGGGMMMRPNPVGMKSGKSVKVKCKLGRNKPTKMY